MGKTKHQKRIEEMMRRMGQNIPERPTVPCESTRILRAKLILEEALETIEALGVSVTPAEYVVPLCMGHLNFTADRPVDMVGIADGGADLSVVSIGTLSACGIDDDPILKEVDRTNLAKFDGDGYRREDGKWIKPTDWEPPRIAELLAKQCEG